MNKRSIHTFVMRFLEAYDCTVLEKTPASVTVKLSPEADREMTGRPYYWSFVERTGAAAETMTYTFVFDPEAHEAEIKAGKGAGGRAGRSDQTGAGPGTGAAGAIGAGTDATAAGAFSAGTSAGATAGSGFGAGTGAGAMAAGAFGAGPGAGVTAAGALGTGPGAGATTAGAFGAGPGAGVTAAGAIGAGPGAGVTAAGAFGAGAGAGATAAGSSASAGPGAGATAAGALGAGPGAGATAAGAGAGVMAAGAFGAGPGAGVTAAGAFGAGPGAYGMGTAASGLAGARGAGGGVATTNASPGPGTAASGESGSGAESILGRYFGFVPTTVTARVPRDEVTLGSRRLEQLFDITLQKGRFVRLFEEPFFLPSAPRTTLVYDTWFCVNYKVELACDRKRSEIHSLAMQLNTGEIREHFHKQLLTKSLSPKLPANLHLLPDLIPVHKAMNELEAHLERIVARYDHSWAAEAHEQHLFELRRVEAYYDGLLMGAEPEQRPQIESQCRNRLQEIDWQYKPRIAVSVINCGMFHLSAPRAPRN
ncbi:hypothetical protein B5M42_010600 [Paenibacillus athensensis]|uniref:Uncharacterized protein n=1 Tax=Paenibacillus athensensis TaxID=1967502 RepID=A0A4Y8PS22_9BACL|nr:YqhG family protein [Paenibacillus athensensis]MCD1259287.1 hypothetical protein [Paenibacillus athensensis]